MNIETTIPNVTPGNWNVSWLAQGTLGNPNRDLYHTLTTNCGLPDGNGSNATFVQFLKGSPHAHAFRIPGDSYWISDDEQLANAHAMSAAKEMYEALALVIPHLVGLLDDPDADEPIEPVVAKIEAAMAKARGDKEASQWYTRLAELRSEEDPAACGVCPHGKQQHERCDDCEANS